MWGLSFLVGKTEKSEIKVWAQLLLSKSVNLFILPPSTWWFAGLVWGSLACRHITPISAFVFTWHFPSCCDGLGAHLLQCDLILNSVYLLLLLLLSRFSRVQLCATPYMAAHQAPPSLGFSRQEHWSGLPFPSPMHENEEWKWSRSVMSDSSWPHGLQPTRLLRPWDFPDKSTGVGCHCLLRMYLQLPYFHQKIIFWGSAAAAKSLQSCLTLCNPIDDSPRGYPVPGILQARTLSVLEIQSINEVGTLFNLSAHDMWWGVSVCVLKLPPHTTADTGWSSSMLWWWTAYWWEVGWPAILVCQDWEGSWEVKLLVLKTTKVQDKQGQVDHPREIVTKTPTEKHQFMPTSQILLSNWDFRLKKDS